MKGCPSHSPSREFLDYDEKQGVSRCVRTRFACGDILRMALLGRDTSQPTECTIFMLMSGQSTDLHLITVTTGWVAAISQADTLQFPATSPRCSASPTMIPFNVPARWQR